MRSVLIAVDFVKDIDGSFKVLELNTGISISPKTIEPYFNKTDFDVFLTQNNITDIDLILLNVGPAYSVDVESGNNTMEGLGLYIEKNYSGYTINRTIVDHRNQIVPTIEDSPNKIIIRQCFDSTALIDDTYAKDNFQFLKLLSDNQPSSIVKTYFNHSTLGIDLIGTTLRDNGDYPNYIIKERFPTKDYSIFPKVLKIDTIEELQNIKQNLSPNTLLQEYVINTNDLENGKLKTYRSIGLVYGPNLDIINLFHPFVHTNPCSIDLTADFTDGNLSPWERPKYLQKYSKDTTSIKYNSDSSNLVLKSDGTLSYPNQLLLNDEIKTINLYGLPDGDSSLTISSYTGTTEDVFSNSVFSSSTIKSIGTINENVWIRNLELSGGLKFSDIAGSKILVKRDGILRFMTFDYVELSDEIVVVNKNTNQFELKTILNEYFTFSNEMIYQIDVEDIDVYLTMDESTTSPTYFVIQHNGPEECRCWYSSCVPPDNWDCFDPCPQPPGLFTGTNYNDCLSLGLGSPYCELLICCRAEPLITPFPFCGPEGGTSCPECQYTKEN